MPRATSRSDSATAVQFVCCAPHSGSARRPDVRDKGPQIVGALRSSQFDHAHRSLVADLLAAKGTSPIWITELDTTRFGSRERGLRALPGKSGLQFRHSSHLRQQEAPHRAWGDVG